MYFVSLNDVLPIGRKKRKKKKKKEKRKLSVHVIYQSRVYQPKYISFEEIPELDILSNSLASGTMTPKLYIVQIFLDISH